VRGVKDLRRAIVGGNVQDAENQAESLVQEGMTGREVFDSVVRPAMDWSASSPRAIDRRQ
jgi:hypothetical protein